MKESSPKKYIGKVVCCVCGKQALLSCTPNIDDKYTTKLAGGRAGFRQGEVFCGYCAEGMDENGLFPEERLQAGID